jgi:hypothetical protein
MFAFGSESVTETFVGHGGEPIVTRRHAAPRPCRRPAEEARQLFAMSTIRRRSASAAVATLLTAGALVVLAPTAYAAPTCGAVITTSTTLTADLVNCPGDGLIIGADNIELDLDGKTIDGVGLGVGVRNDGFDDVTIHGGTVQEFAYGIQLNAGTTQNLVETMTLKFNELAGVELSEAGNNEVLDSTMEQQSKQGISVLNPGFRS